MAALDIDGAIQNIKTALSGIADWQSICGVATSAEAAERIYEYGADESDGCSLAPCMILDLEDSELPWNGGKLQGNVTITCRIELPIPPDYQHTYSQQGRYFWQKLQAILAGIESASGSGGELMLESLTMPVKPGRIDPDENNGRIEWMCMLGLVVYLK